MIFIYLQKKTLSKTYNGKSNSTFIKKYNIKLKLEELLSESQFKKLRLTDIKLINIKLRLSFLLKEQDSNFRIDLDLIHNVNLKQNNLKDLKNRIFKPYKLSNIVEELNYDFYLFF